MFPFGQANFLLERTVTEMYEELVAKLRDHNACISIKTLDDAADAIEELQGQIDGWIDQERKALIKSLPRWIPVTERLPEESEGLNWHEDMMIRFTSVWCCDAKTGTIEARNRLQGKMTGNEYLDQYTKDTDWHWSKSWWEPTHWMPIVPLPEPPKEEQI